MLSRGESVALESYLELRVGESDWVAVWTSLVGRAPIEGLRESWEDCRVVFFPTSRRLSVLGSFDCATVTASILDKEGLEFRFFLSPGNGLALRAVTSKWLHRWLEAVARHATMSAPAPPSDALEARLREAVQICSFFTNVAETAGLRFSAADAVRKTLEKTVHELTAELSRLKKGSATPVAALDAPPPPPPVRLQGASVAALVEVLRARGASAIQTARHLYVALGRRPHEEAAMPPPSPASRSLLDELPRVSPAQQLEQLTSFISKNDPFAMEVLQGYATVFLRLKGLDVDLALRRLLFHFRLPRESQQIARVVRALSEAYFKLHGGLTAFDHASSAFAPASPDDRHHYGPGEAVAWGDRESVELIVFALVMLNGDLHNPENTDKMTRPEFVENIKRSGAKVVLSDATLGDMYNRIQADPMSFDAKLVPYPDAVRKGVLDAKVSGVAGLRLWKPTWVVVCENYDAASTAQRGLGFVFLCKSSRDESAVYLMFPLKRSTALAETGKRELVLTAPLQEAGGTTATGGTLRSVLGVATDETRVKLRFKTDAEHDLWLRTLRYLLGGGYSHWYPNEGALHDEALDVPEVVVTTGGTKKTRRRRPKKGGTLKGAKRQLAVEPPAAAAATAPPASQGPALANSPRGTIFEVASDSDHSP